MSSDFEKSKEEAFLEYMKISEEIDSLLEETRFDLHSQDIKKWEWMQEFIPEIIVSSAGGLSPFQAEGFIEDFFFYYRERGGVASLRLSDSIDKSYGYNSSLYSASLEVEEFRSGSGWIETFFNLYERLEKTKNLYDFESNEVKFNGDGKPYLTGEKSTTAEWGYTSDEAYNEIIKHQDSEKTIKIWTDYRKFSRENYLEYIRLRDVQNKVLNIEYNDKNYPEVEPVFKVITPESWRQADGSIRIPEDFFEDQG